MLFFFFFSVKMPRSSDKTVVTAASALTSLAAATLAVASSSSSSSSSSSVVLKCSLQHLAAVRLVAAKRTLIGDVISKPSENSLDLLKSHRFTCIARLWEFKITV